MKIFKLLFSMLNKFYPNYRFHVSVCLYFILGGIDLAILRHFSKLTFFVCECIVAQYIKIKGTVPRDFHFK
jgi:hypothetical protein